MILDINQFYEEEHTASKSILHGGKEYIAYDEVIRLLKKCNDHQLRLYGVVNSKIKITADENCEMLKIEKEGSELFYGNETDFNRDAETFGKLFKNLGVECVIIKKPYNEWS